MFIHIGGDVMISTEELIGIFDFQIGNSIYTQGFIEQANADQIIEIIDTGELKSIIVTEKKLYYSPISATTLKRRAISQEEQDNLVLNCY